MYEISIIVPVYNVEKYIRRCIDSLITQTFKSIEILLIDDGSKDSSGAICDEYALKDDRVKVFHKKNGGVSSARNVGLDNATGTYIMFCDPDDYVDLTWCERLHNAIERSGGFFACCGYNSIRSSGEMKQKNYIQNEDIAPAKKLIILYQKELLHSIWSKIFVLTEINEKNLRFDETINKAEDAIFVLQYLRIKSGNIGIVTDTLYHYVSDRPESLTKQTVLDSWNLSCRFFREIRKTMKVYGIDFSEYSETYYSNMITAILQSLNVLFTQNNSRRVIFACGKEIINSDECKDAFKNGDIVNVHPIYRKILYTRCFLLVWLFHQAVDFKHHMIG